MQIIPHIAGAGEKGVLRYMFHAQPFKAPVVPEARYLGGFFTFDFATGVERERRADAIRAGHHKLGAFWYSCPDFEHLRTVLAAKVVSPSLSGLTVFVLPQKDSDALDKIIAGYARKIIRKQNALKNEESGEVIC